MNSSNKTMVPEAQDAMNRFKMEAANEVGSGRPLFAFLFIVFNQLAGFRERFGANAAGEQAAVFLRKAAKRRFNAVKGHIVSVFENSHAAVIGAHGEECFVFLKIC